MELIRPTREQAEAGLRAMKAVLTSDGTLNPIERGWMQAAQRHVLDTAFELDSLGPITPDELAARIVEPAARNQFANALVIASFVSGEASETQARVIEAYTSALGVDVPELHDLRLLAERKLAMLRFDVVRRMYIGERIEQLYEDRGFTGILKALGAFRGLVVDHELAAKYGALGELPRGTLGRAYFDHCRANRFPLPGERGGAPELMVTHDMAHVLGDYTTEPEGEMEVAAFTAGFRREQTTSILLFVLCQFDLGVRIAPAAKAEVGTLDPPRFLAALVRGSQMTLDLFDGWDHWPVITEELDTLRARYGIPPKA